ncbi:acyltransferase [uncultured Photobacterium sp.]|uniref:acyltransferase n=1 Tax=uncultured Photobacterium sp. TaxID=173973 RepID=UPI00262DB2AE|nr:acyltransferase [uncultured Photobacterium sp.]
MRQKIVYFDVMRCVAAIAVVVIHVLGPYRDQLGAIPDSSWITAITFNSFSRWAVPVFIMITGALMLSDTREFDLQYYVRRRLGKVLAPFLVWSLFYAALSGLTAAGYTAATAFETLKAMPSHETYYHLGFFYYFIPLYFVVPFLRHYVQRTDQGGVIGLTCVWLVLTTLFLLKIDGFWGHQLILYSGYLLLGYGLYHYQWPSLKWLVVLGGGGLLLTDYMVINNSLSAGEYTVGRWLSYKTLNTAMIAAMVFALCRHYGERLSSAWLARTAFMSRYSLGIYLLHPIFLWPVREYNLYFAHPLITIPFWTVICTALALLASWGLGKHPKTAWLVP